MLVIIRVKKDSEPQHILLQSGVSLGIGGLLWRCLLPDNPSENSPPQPIHSCLRSGTAIHGAGEREGKETHDTDGDDGYEWVDVQPPIHHPIPPREALGMGTQEPRHSHLRAHSGPHYQAYWSHQINSTLGKGNRDGGFSRHFPEIQ